MNAPALRIDGEDAVTRGLMLVAEEARESGALVTCTGMVKEKRGSWFLYGVALWSAAWTMRARVLYVKQV